MKRIIALVIMCCCSMDISAQQFIPKFTLALPDTIQQSTTAWVDLDNDGLLDIVLLAENVQGEDYLMFVKGDTVSAPGLHPESLRIADVKAYTWVDYNHDNAMDMIVSGTRSGAAVTILYQNRGGFKFDELVLSMPAFSHTLFVDLNNDARREWIIAGGAGTDGYLMAFSEDGYGLWKPVADTVAIAATALDIVDADHNGIHDLFVSGHITADSLFTGFLIMQGDTAFTPYLGQEWAGMAAIADLNADGIQDVVFSGLDAHGHQVDKIWTSSPSSYTISNMPVSLAEASVFLADLDSDGIVDYSLSGKNPAGGTLHLLRYATHDFDTLDTRHVAHYAFGDAEHDGDLDMLQVAMENTPMLRLLENHAAANHAPSKPLETVAIRVYDRTFVHWAVSTDDHTPDKSITYDVFVQTQGQEVQTGDFDLANDRRLVTKPGNNGAYNFKLLKGIASGNFNYVVQAVDNALHAHAICFGSGGGGGGACAVVEPQVITTCKAGEVLLPGSEGTQWFSFASGFLGEVPSLEFEPEKQDTVFSFNPASGAGCDALRTYVIQIRDSIQEQPVARYGCQHASIILDAGPASQHVTWESLLKGDLGSSRTINYLVQQPDSIFSVVEDAEGCKVSRTIAIIPSIPQVAVMADRYKIIRGTEVQLQATGAVRYVWSPATGLDRTDIANPIARPDATTQYQVEGYDSLDCSARAQVTIMVEGSGFIPNLFTPNGDGKNDRLKIFGLDVATDFTLTISNREGSVVFRTTDIDEALTRGWDGTHRGMEQPGGIYFWKLKGQTVNGSKLLLNGKESGSIVLVH